MNYQVGERVGDYQIVDVLGAGGMGKVYKVRNIISERVEAMKVLLPNLESDPELGDRFMREIKVQASLDHPNIAGLHTAQRVGNQLLMIMEYVEGTTLEALLQRGPAPLDKGLNYISQVLSALSYAHSRGVVHRDIKPANMMLAPDGTIKLMDFGIAKMSEDRKLTQTGRTVGSLYYMSPEQINGAVLDARSDLYSLGVSLYELVTGKRPFHGDSDYSIMAAHLNTPPVPPIQIDPRLPETLNEIILMSIAKDPAQRFQTAAAFQKALESTARSLGFAPPAAAVAAAGVGAARGPAPMPAAASPVTASTGKSRRGIYIAIGSVATVAVLAAGAILIPRWSRPSAATSAEQQAPIALPSPSSQEPADPTQQPEVQTPQVPAQPQPADQAAPSTPAPQPGAQTTQVPAQTRPSNQAAPSTPAPRPASPVLSPQQPTRPQPSAVAAQAPGAQGSPAQTARQPVPAQNVAQQPPVAQNTPDPGRIAALNEMREHFVMLGTRAGSIKLSLNTLRQQQAAQGVGVRPDLLTAQQRMDFFLSEGEGALKRGDPVSAKKSLDSAERELEKLEKFFNR